MNDHGPAKERTRVRRLEVRTLDRDLLATSPVFRDFDVAEISEVLPLLRRQPMLSIRRTEVATCAGSIVRTAVSLLMDVKAVHAGRSILQVDGNLDSVFLFGEARGTRKLGTALPLNLHRNRSRTGSLFGLSGSLLSRGFRGVFRNRRCGPLAPSAGQRNDGGDCSNPNRGRSMSLFHHSEKMQIPCRPRIHLPLIPGEELAEPTRDSNGPHTGRLHTRTIPPSALEAGRGGCFIRDESTIDC